MSSHVLFVENVRWEDKILISLVVVSSVAIHVDILTCRILCSGSSRDVSDPEISSEKYCWPFIVASKQHKGIGKALTNTFSPDEHR